MSKAYILGVLHDGTERKLTYRISSKSKAFVDFLARKIKKLGRKAWVYKEGKNRNLFIVEFSKSFLKNYRIRSKKEKLDYIKGYFDAEGGIAKSTKIRFYLYFCQKNIRDLIIVRKYLEELNIKCGKIHNPSVKADPDYFRFYIKAESYKDYIKTIGSWHPEKKAYLKRMKI